MILARAGGLALVAALAAVLLGPVAGPLPPEQAMAAASDLTLVGAATYTVLPSEARVHVIVHFTIRNRKAETKTRKFYFDRAYIAVQPGTRAFKVTDWRGAKVKVAKRTPTYTMLRLDFGARLYGGKSHDLTLSFDIPDPGRAANSQVRVGTSLVTFPVWAFASDGASGSTASVRFPAGYEVVVESGSFDGQRATTDGGTVLDAGPLANPLAFFAYVSGQKAAVYVDSALTVPTGAEDVPLTLRAWEDDPGWAARVGPLFERSLPILRSGIGIAWPHAAPVVVQEALSRSADGYAGLFDGGEGRIEIAYWASPLVVVHEAAHGWFNGALLADRWANEGFASLYAGRAAVQLKIKGAGPALTPEVATPAVPLNAWAADGSADPAVERYGYAASLVLARAIAERAGDPALARVWADAAGGIGAYQPVIPGAAPGATTPGATTPGATPETVDAPPDWRGLLDLLEMETGADFTDLWRTWVVRDGEAVLLDARAASVASYEQTLALADGWTLPRVIRDALRAWQFTAADRLMADARTVLAQRAALEQMALHDGLVLPDTMRTLFEAGSLADASAEAEAELNAMLAIGQAADARAADTDALTTIGMIGENPEVDLRAAETAFSAGDLDRVLDDADRAFRAWNEAWQEGRRRALLALATLATILVLGSAVVGRVRKVRRAQPSEAAGAYATLRASAPPGDAPDAPPQPHDEGADRS
jgi:hypothetical protein